MKINQDATVQPPRFGDRTLNKTLGEVIGKQSENDVHAVVFRYAEIRTVMEVRKTWLDLVKFIADSSEPNAEFFKVIPTDPTWASVASEALDFLRADQESLDRENRLAHAHIALCDKVITALTKSFAGPPLANAYKVGGIRDSSPLQHLQLSVAASNRAAGRVGTANLAWEPAIKRFMAEGGSRNAFASTAASVTLAQLDTSPASTFEEWTAWLLERDGCQILRRHGGSNDQGADVIALTPDGLRIVLQCKHSTKLRNRVDPKYLHELNGTARPEHGADIVGIVTNRTLSDRAQSFATRHKIHVIDRSVLKRWATYGVSWLPSDTHTTASSGSRHI